MAGSSGWLGIPKGLGVVSPQQRDSGLQRNKVALRPGRSLMDWIRLTNSSQDLAGTKGLIRDVTEEELRKHNKTYDAWMVLKGKVYNVTPYMEFHPGGEEELMRGVGTDATDLFNSIHRWVNAESMLQKCLIGKYRPLSPLSSSGSINRTSGHEGDKFRKPETLGNGTSTAVKPKPRYEWSEEDTSVSLVIHTTINSIKTEHVIVDLDETELLLSIQIRQFTYQLHLDLENRVLPTYQVNAKQSSGTVELVMTKEDPEIPWSDIGTPLSGHDSCIETKNKDIHYRICELSERTQLTHDCYLFTFSFPLGTRMWIPVGHHVHLRQNIKDMDIVRSYTPVLPSVTDLKSEETETNGESVSLMIKIYPEGVLTPHLKNLEIGDSIEVSDCTGDFDDNILSRYSHLALFAAGTGITPMIRLIQRSLRDGIHVQLMFFNKKEHDIVWRSNFDELAQSCSRFEVTYVLSEPHDNWPGMRGRVRPHIIEKFLPTCEKLKQFMCICGPSPFTKATMKYLEEIGYHSSHVYVFVGL
ncbi:cytochrome b5 reductase 4 isoform X2 [Tachypleus tridentatus]